MMADPVPVPILVPTGIRSDLALDNLMPGMLQDARNVRIEQGVIKKASGIVAVNTVRFAGPIRAIAQLMRD